MRYRIKVITENNQHSFANVDIQLLKQPNSKLIIQLDDQRYFEAIAGDAFQALRMIRSETEALGIKFLIQGCRPNCWPSGMSAQMSNGNRIYEKHLLDNRDYRLVNTFDEAAESEIGTLQDQDYFTKKWLEVVTNGG